MVSSGRDRATGQRARRSAGEWAIDRTPHAAHGQDHQADAAPQHHRRRQAGQAPATADVLKQMLALCLATLAGRRDRAQASTSARAAGPPGGSPDHLAPAIGNPGGGRVRRGCGSWACASRRSASAGANPSDIRAGGHLGVITPMRNWMRRSGARLVALGHGSLVAYRVP